MLLILNGVIGCLLVILVILFLIRSSGRPLARVRRWLRRRSWPKEIRHLPEPSTAWQDWGEAQIERVRQGKPILWMERPDLTTYPRPIPPQWILPPPSAPTPGPVSKPLVSPSVRAVWFPTLCLGMGREESSN